MKKFLFLIPIIVFFSCNSGENISPSDNYVKFFGGGATYELMDMTLRADGADGVVLLALRTGDVVLADTTIENRKDLYVIVTDGAGNPVTEKRIPINGVEPELIFVEADSARARVTTIDGSGYYVVSSTAAAPAASPSNIRALAVWAEFDDNFDLVGTSWNTVGDTIDNYYGRDIAIATDGGVVVGGYTDALGTNDFFYNKIGGTITWSRVQGGPGSDDRLVRLFATGDGRFVIIGRTDVASTDGEGGANVKRSLIDQNGVLVNSLNYGITINTNTNLWDIPYDVIERPGGYTVVGASYTTSALADGGIPFFMNVDINGANTTEVEYSTILDGSKGQAIGVTQTTSNDFIVVGEVDGLDDNGKEILIMKTDQQGGNIGELIRFGLVNGDESARRALTAPDGSIYVGATYDFGGGLSQIGLLKLNSDGELRQ